MDKYEIEVAKADVDSGSEHVAPVFDLMRQDLLGEMALQKADIVGDMVHETQGARNYRLISDFVAALPRAKRQDRISEFQLPPLVAGHHYVNYSFLTKDPFKVRALQASLVFVKAKFPQRVTGAPAGNTLTDIPHYVVGNNGSRLLLATICDNVGNGAKYPTPWARQIISVKASAGNRARLEAQSARLSQNVDGNAEFEEMYDKQDRYFHLRASTVGNLVLGRKVWRSRRLVKWLLDTDMIEYKVHDHLKELATTFNQPMTYKKLLDESVVE